MATNTATPRTTGRADGLGAAAYWLTLITLCGATFLIALDFSIVTVALPAIGRDLRFADTGSLQWVATACLLPTASLLPLFGRLSDLVGRRRLLVVGLLAVTVFSLLAGLAVSPGMLIAARIGQGVAGAAVAPTALALMTTSFPEGPQRTRALGVNGALLSLGFVVGTIGGGLITSGLSWRWTMLIMMIIAAAVLVSVLLVVPRGAAATAARLDVPGAVLASGGLFALVYAISTGADAGWAGLSTLGSLAAAVVLIAAFLAVESRHPAPLVPLTLLRRRTISWGGLVGFLTFGMCGGTTVLLSLYLQDVLHYSALATGVGFLAEGAAALVAGGLVARLLAAAGTTRILVLGLAVQAAGTATMVLLPLGGNLPLLLATSAAMGFGHVLSVVSVITTMTSGLHDEEQGVAGSLAQMPQFVGSIGVAGLAAIVAARSHALAGHLGTAAATLGGLHAAMLTAAVALTAGILVTVALLHHPSPTT